MASLQQLGGPQAHAVASLQQLGGPQAHAASLPKAPVKCSIAVPGTFGQQDGASSGGSEFSELENKEALKRPSAKKGGPVLRRVQSECRRSPVSCSALALASSAAVHFLCVLPAHATRCP